MPGIGTQGLRPDTGDVRLGISIHAAQAMLPGGWASDARITIEDGRIATVQTGIPPQPGDDDQAVLIPGMPNLHSHAFQRGMAGLAEVGGPAGDSFWTWRDLMYHFAGAMTPEHLASIALMLQVEMLEAGYTRVGEFHYLHHDHDGTPFADIGELAGRILHASVESGIRLTLLPVFYAHGGFGGMPPSLRQRRFTNDLDRFARLHERCRDLLSGLDGAVLGIAPHSLRAVSPEELAAVVAMQPEGPIHIHIAEQTQEVEACLAWSGRRPVNWLLDHADVDRRWCLIHATHLEVHELNRLGRTGAVAGLCPITEANLGDGTFRGREFLAAHGSFGIGTDSNVQVSVPAELRQFEYSQRLMRRERNVLTGTGQANARTLYEMALEGGSRAIGASAAAIVPGAPADLVSLASDRVDLANGDRALSSWVFTERVGVESVWVGGHRVVAGGRHLRRDEAVAGFRATMRVLVDKL